MKKISLILMVIVFIAAVILLLQSAFIVTETEQALITQLGRPVRVITGNSQFIDPKEVQASVDQYNDENKTNVRLSSGANLYFKVPFLQQVEYFEDRILESDAEPDLIITGDSKRLMVDNFARWHISNPLRFKQTVQTIPGALKQIGNIIRSDLLNQLGTYDFIEIIRNTDQMLQYEDTEIEIPIQKQIPVKVGRGRIMEEVTRLSREKAKAFGIYIVDVRIKRADPPKQNLNAIFNNMNSERNRIAEEYRAQGEQAAMVVRAETKRKIETMIAQAERQAQIVMGQADAEAAKIYAQGYIKNATGPNPVSIAGYETDPEFYQFTRTLGALEKVLDGQSSFILSTQNGLLKTLNNPPSLNNE